MSLTHHDLCFGCGLANVFGLQMELETGARGAVTGRFFVKQDHQGPPGAAHGGVLAAALDDAMGIAVGGEPAHVTRRLEVDFHAPARVGTFVRVEARLERREAGTAWLSAEALGGESGRELLAQARGVFVEAGAALR